MIKDAKRYTRGEFPGGEPDYERMLKDIIAMQQRIADIHDQVDEKLVRGLSRARGGLELQVFSSSKR